MYSLSIAIGAMSWRMLYQDEEKAKTAYAALKDTTVPAVEIADDYGQVGVFKTGMGVLPAVMLEDMDKSKMAEIDIAIHRQKVQMLAQKMAAADPAIRAAQMGAGLQPLSPMGGNGFRPS